MLKPENIKITETGNLEEKTATAEIDLKENVRWSLDVYPFGPPNKNAILKYRVFNHLYGDLREIILELRCIAIRASTGPNKMMQLINLLEKKMRFVDAILPTEKPNKPYTQCGPTPGKTTIAKPPIQYTDNVE